MCGALRKENSRVCAVSCAALFAVHASFLLCAANSRVRLVFDTAFAFQPDAARPVLKALLMTLPLLALAAYVAVTKRNVEGNFALCQGETVIAVIWPAHLCSCSTRRHFDD